ncbi:hypothetical protein [Nocardia sp. XZ_19_369]|uniref:hypothetical protein n=1 Tax=Nocardia sp. XZ_19_369 TaxID=2769487 RepID=UPI00188F8785|nr:hypothetical protein [Nocardia sp. XZ_19_369]
MFLSTRRLVLLLTVGMIGLLSPVTADAAPPDPTMFGDLCIRTQSQTANLNVVAFRRAGGSLEKTVYSDLASFAAAKPLVRPLTVARYTSYEDAAATQPKQVRCKGKSADHLTAVYGADLAGPEGTCAEANRQTVAETARMLTPPERDALVHRPNTILIDSDTQAVNGPDWLAEFPAATLDSAGTLHLGSKSLYVPFTTPGIPEAFKGQHYCTLIAHAYLKRLMLGLTQP